MSKKHEPQSTRLTRRQRKELARQEKKKWERELREQGIHRTQAKQIAREVSTKQALRNKVKQINYQRLREAGFSRDEARSIASRTYDKVSHVLAERKRAEPKKVSKQRTKKAEEGLPGHSILIFWGDSLDHGDEESVEYEKGRVRHMTVESLHYEIQGRMMMDMGIGVLGEYEVIIVPDSQKKKAIHENSLHGMFTVYEGKGKRYKELLVAIAAMCILIYDQVSKRSFLHDVLTALKVLSPTNANRLRQGVFG